MFEDDLSWPMVGGTCLEVLDFLAAEKDAIRSSTSSINWAAAFSSLNIDNMTEVFPSLLLTFCQHTFPTKLNASTEYTIST